NHSAASRDLISFPTRRSSDLGLLPFGQPQPGRAGYPAAGRLHPGDQPARRDQSLGSGGPAHGQRAVGEKGKKSPEALPWTWEARSEEHTSELQSREKLVCRLL